MRSDPLRLRSIAVPVALLVLSALAAAQERYARPLITEPLDEAQRIVLKGNIHPLARTKFEVGPAPPNLPMERMLLVLKRSQEQETALLKLLDDQQDKSSPEFHKWLTPEQFGQRFGPDDSDIQIVTSWLRGHGFEIAQVNSGRTLIEFSGTAAQVQQAFHTAIRKYVVNGKAHWANANDPEIPAALAPAVAGVHTLHNFYLPPHVVLSPETVQAKVGAGPRPQVTLSNGVHGLRPSDLAVIYNASPLLAGPINGQGETIAVIGRSNLFIWDVYDFRNVFIAGGGDVSVILNGPDPGPLGGNEQVEATLDATWSAALAPLASVAFVVSASTNSTDGIFLSESYIIDNNLAPVMTESFGGCETLLSSAELQGVSAMAEQAAAQGITYLVASGDTGAEGCDDQGESVAQGPLSVNDLASNPFTVAVGGTQFNENGQNSLYWNTVNDPHLASAKSYIPEDVWNESCAAAQCGSKPNILASGGGVSTIFSKPSSQTGVSGIPNNGARDLPDVSLTAAGHDPYLLCLNGSCEPDSQGFISLAAVRGTSASTQAFGGIMALVNQRTASRQGQANYVLYRLAAAENLSQCNGSNTAVLPASTCVFNDVTVGNNAVPGETGFGTPGAQYQSKVGYDLSTGLGSVNVTNLVNQWSSAAFNATTTTLVLTPTTFTHGAPANVTINVSPSSGAGVPTGDVSLLTDLYFSGLGVPFFTLNAGSVSGTSGSLPGGTYDVHAHYAGDGTFAASDSTLTTITVSPEGSTTAVSIFGLDTNGNPIPFVSQPYGSPVYLRADVSGLSGHGVATGRVLLTDNGIQISDPALSSDGSATTPAGVFTIPSGSSSVVATYSGDRSFNASTSAAVQMTVTQAPTTTTLAASSSSPVTLSTPVTLAATINSTSGGNQPNGTVTFLSNGAVIATEGNPIQLSGYSGEGNIQTGLFMPASGTATLTTALPVGQGIITAQYSGDSNYAGSTSPATTVNVLPDFVFAAATRTIIIASPGGSGTVMLTVTGQPGFSGTINFSPTSCTGLPSEATCSFNPTSVTNTGSTTLTISTTAAHAARLEGPSWLTTTLGVGLAGIFLVGSGSRRRAWSRLLSLMAIACLITLASCGGGSRGGGGGGGNSDPGTPADTSLVTVTATSGTITHTAIVSLTVQ